MTRTESTTMQLARFTASRRRVMGTAVLATAALGGLGYRSWASAAPNSQDAAGSMSIALGVQMPGLPNDPGEIDTFNTLVGGKAAIALWFSTWAEPLIDVPTLDSITATGSIPMLTWEPWASDAQIEPALYPLRSIADGAFDDYIRQSAQDAAAYGKPFFLRFAEEMNGGWFPWGVGVNGNTANDYLAAWQHVVTVFREEGADNAVWVWSPNSEYDGLYPFSDLYPGDEWVDWVGLDGYNWGSQEQSGWRTFSDVFYPSYQTATALTDKPVMIAEMASTEMGGDKAEWIRQGMLTDLPTLMPRIQAVVWFNRVKETDWRVESSETSLTAYKEVTGSSLYSGGPSDLIPSFTAE